jgi:hypothetical protein
METQLNTLKSVKGLEVWYVTDKSKCDAGEVHDVGL